MMLTLEINGPEAAKLGPERRKVFDGVGGTIGRSADCAWVLQDPYISGRHALIRYTGGVYYIEDTRSRNGVFINTMDNRLEDGQAYALQPGDRILIEPYEIRVSLTPAAQEIRAPRPEPAAAGFRAAAVPRAADPFGLDDPFAGAAAAPAPRPAPPSGPPGLLDDHTPLPAHDVDPLNLLGLDGAPPPVRDVPRSEQLAESSLLHEHYEPPVLPPGPPAAAKHSSIIPDDYNPLESQVIRPSSARPATPRPATPRPATPRPVPRQHRAVPKEAPAAKSVHSDGGLADVLAGAGLENVPVTPELAQNFGEILRVVVAGVMDVLQARQEIKDEFRIRVTTFKRADNNPLKFSANVEDALHNLLVKRNAAYLAPVDAFEDAFDDLRNHQIAMLQGLRAAFAAMLAEFSPDRLQEEFDRQIKKGSALLAGPAKLRYWDLYREKVNDIVRDTEGSFRRLFGDEFAREYEDQLRRLKSQRRQDPR